MPSMTSAIADAAEQTVADIAVRTHLPLSPVTATSMKGAERALIAAGVRPPVARRAIHRAIAAGHVSIRTTRSGSHLLWINDRNAVPA